MITSMTGFGKGEVVTKYSKVTIEIQTVNRKHLEIQLTIPREYSEYDPAIRQIIARSFSRGRVQVHLAIQKIESIENEYLIDSELAKDYLSAADELSQELGIENNLTLQDIMQNKDIVRLEQKETAIENLKESLSEALELAVTEVKNMRQQEGSFLLADIQDRLDTIHVNLKQIQNLAPLISERHRNKLEMKIKEMLGSADISEDRILTETAIYADKSDITEEIVRLLSHLEQFQNLFDEEQSIGRSLDFIVQEMLRETSTILAKSDDKDISQTILEVKIELDKIREQIQNIE